MGGVGRRLGGTGVRKEKDVGQTALYTEANESVARFVAYAGSWVFWGLVGVIAGAILLVS